MKTIDQKTEYSLHELHQWRQRVENSYTMSVFGKDSPKMTEAEYLVKLEEIDALIAAKIEETGEEMAKADWISGSWSDSED